MNHKLLRVSPAALLAALTFLGAGRFAHAGDAPKLDFDRLVYDIGKTSEVETVAGVFKYTNSGTAVLKMDPPKPSCGCTVAGLKPDTLNPGETGELSFTLNLGHYRATIEKHITVKSNDPKTPEVTLSIKADYTPLYDVTPMAIMADLPMGLHETNQTVTITRTDGKPLNLAKLEPSKPWITAHLEPGGLPGSSTAQVRVGVQREGAPRRFNEAIQVYALGRTNSPVTTIFLYGQMMGELEVSPESVYWSVTDPAKIKSERPESFVTRRIAILSADGKPFELKNPQSSLKEVQVDLAPKEHGRAYELVATLKDVPNVTIGGSISFETSVAAQPKMEVPVIVSVLKPSLQ